MKKYDNITVGLISGFLLPLVAWTIYWQVNFNYMSLMTFVRYLIAGNAYTQLMSLCVIPNLGLFFLFIQTDRYLSARGMIMATIIYAIINFTLKVF